MGVHVCICVCVCECVNVCVCVCVCVCKFTDDGLDGKFSDEFLARACVKGLKAHGALSGALTRACLCQVKIQRDPKTAKEALTSPEAREWIAAMRAGMLPLIEQGTFIICEQPRGRRVIPTKPALEIPRTSPGEQVVNLAMHADDLLILYTDSARARVDALEACMNASTKEALNPRVLLAAVCFGQPGTMTLHCDNKGGTTMSLHPANKPATGHV